MPPHTQRPTSPACAQRRAGWASSMPHNRPCVRQHETSQLPRAARAGGKPNSPMRPLAHALAVGTSRAHHPNDIPPSTTGPATLCLHTAPWAPGLEYRYRRYGLEKTGLVYTNSSPSRSWATRKSSSTYTHLVDDKRAGCVRLTSVPWTASVQFWFLHSSVL